MDDGGAPPTERLASFAAKFFEGAGPTMTTMMNRPIAVGVLGMDDVTTAELLRQVPLPWVLVEIRYARGLSGAHWLILGQPAPSCSVTRSRGTRAARRSSSCRRTRRRSARR